MEYTVVINGEGLVMGRLAALAAKKALNGEVIAITNCEKVVITGRREFTYKKYFTLVKKGKATRGPYMPRRSDLFMKRIIRGMLPYKKARGRGAYKNIMCFVGVPKELEGRKIQKLKEAENKRLIGFMTVRELTKMLGSRA